MKSETFFNETEKQQIADTIAAVEKKTSGEIAVMVVAASDTYPEASLLAGLTISGLSALLLTDLFLADSLAFFVPLMAVGIVVVGSLTRITPWLLRLFTTDTRLEARVSQRALLAFYEKGLHATRDRTGVLFFFSLLERRVWILADTGIYEKISPESLQVHAKELAAASKQGQASKTLCRKIEETGQILARHFPVKADDRNELPNEVIVG